MKQMRKRLMRLLSAGVGLALLAGMLPGALAASSVLKYEVDSDDVLEIKRKDLNSFCEDETGEGLDFVQFTDLPSSSRGELYYLDGDNRKQTIWEDE